MKILPLVFTLALSVVVSAPLQAQMHGGMPGSMHGAMHGRPGGRGGFGPPAFLEKLYPPQLVMRFQEEIGLSPEQRASISQAMADTQKSMIDLQWQNEAEAGKLEKLLDATTVDEAGASAQADRVMAMETQTKKAHLMLLIRIKNLLNQSQQQKLRELRPKGGGFALPAPPPGE